MTVNKPQNRQKNRGKHAFPESAKKHQFQPGQSGNPGGRPRKGKFAEMLTAMADEIVPDDPKRRTWKRFLADQIFLQAAKGNVQAFAEIVNRVEGKAVPRTDIAMNQPEDAPREKLLDFIRKLKSREKSADHANLIKRH